MEETQVKDLQTEVAVLKRDINQFGVLFTKLDVTIEKIGDVSNNISKLLAVHEQRLDVLNNMDKQLEDKIVKQRDDIASDIKELHTRITLNNEHLLKALNETEKSIKMHIDSEHMRQDKEIRNVEKKIDSLEKWKWFVIGGAVVVGYLISHLDINSLFK